VQQARERFAAALDDDFNTPLALNALDALAAATLEQPTAERVAAVRELGGVLGLTLDGANPSAPAWTFK
jgi:cysteinyl-tRNA synthetase